MFIIKSWQFNIVDNKVANIGAVKKKLLKQFEDKNHLLFYVTDVLVKFLYSKKRKRKQLLWFLFGEYIENNIRRHQDQPEIKYVECEDCGELFEIPKNNKRTVRCDRCQKIRNDERKDDFKERHDFRLFGIHIFVNGNFNFFEYLHLILMFYDCISHYLSIL